jgi:two-component system chemotaxis sensor kinase CheA
VESSLNRFRGIAPEIAYVMNEKKNRPVKTGESHYGIHIELSSDIFYRGQDPLLLINELKSLGEMDSVRCNTRALPVFDQLDPLKCYFTYDMVLRSVHTIADIRDVFIFVVDDNIIRVNDISDRFVEGVDVELADKRVGEILVDEGILDEETVEAVASKHKKIGEELVEKSGVDEQVVKKVLDRKQRSKKIQIASTIRVNTDKLDKLINLIGEMVISVARVSLIGQESGNKEIINSTVELNRISRELQEQIMMVRMVPLESTFKRFYRVVRDISNSQGKLIELKISGEDTELDKTMIEQIADPLKHMIRNSIDHGVESPDLRKKKQKPEKGTIWLRAYQEEGNVIIEIEDDGQGIDPDKIYKKAVEKGLIKKSRSSFSDEEVFSFLFIPGFSTAEQVTEISGRGVGMDVVKRNVESLKGKIEVSSVTGKGSKFKIKIPLTIAIIDGMHLRVGHGQYIIPLDAIVETFQYSALDMKSVKGAPDLVNLRGQVYPLIRLHDYFGEKIGEDDGQRRGIVVLVESTFKKFCIFVDEIIGISQAVIKNLQKNYKSIPGVIGASLNGDGSISLIIDIPGIEKVMGI